MNEHPTPESLLNDFLLFAELSEPKQGMHYLGKETRANLLVNIPEAIKTMRASMTQEEARLYRKIANQMYPVSDQTPPAPSDQ